MEVTLGLIFLSVISFLIYWWILENKNYWKKYSQIPSIPGLPLLGNFKDVLFMRTSPADAMMEYYNHKNAKNQPVIGVNVAHNPGLVIRSPELCKQILVKDFNQFSNRYSSSDPKSDALGSYNLFFHDNPGWRELRMKLSPLFSSGKIKQMFNLIQDVAKQLDEILVDKNKFIDIKEINSRYTTDVIATCAFGIEANSLKDPDAEFRENGKRIFNFTFYRALEFTCTFFIPQVVSWLKFKVFSEETNNFIRSTMKEVMMAREQQGDKRNDLIDTLLLIRDDIKNSTTIFAPNMSKYCIIWVIAY